VKASKSTLTLHSKTVWLSTGLRPGQQSPLLLYQTAHGFTTTRSA